MPKDHIDRQCHHLFDFSWRHDDVDNKNKIDWNKADADAEMNYLLQVPVLPVPVLIVLLL